MQSYILRKTKIFIHRSVISSCYQSHIHWDFWAKSPTLFYDRINFINNENAINLLVIFIKIKFGILAVGYILKEWKGLHS